MAGKLLQSTKVYKTAISDIKAYLSELADKI